MLDFCTISCPEITGDVGTLAPSVITYYLISSNKPGITPLFAFYATWIEPGVPPLSIAARCPDTCRGSFMTKPAALLNSLPGRAV